MTDEYSPEAVAQLIADCTLAAECMADKETFPTGQAILKEAADMLEALAAELAEVKAQRNRFLDISNQLLKQVQTQTIADAPESSTAERTDWQAIIESRLTKVEAEIQRFLAQTSTTGPFMLLPQPGGGGNSLGNPTAYRSGIYNHNSFTYHDLNDPRPRQDTKNE